MTGLRERVDPADLRTASVVVLCMSVSAGLALAVESVWLWPVWLIVLTAAALGVAVGVASGLHQPAARRRSD